jgi:hypothetical protein
MTNYFHHLLKKKGLESHDRRSLWQYNLSKFEFETLKETLKSSLFNFKKNASDYLYPIDVTLYFSEFWRQQYDGTKKPSIKTIVASLQIEESKHNLIYDIAKEGAKKLGLSWINIGVNDLKFRTILSQGGIPLNFFKKDNNSFSTFIRRLIQAEITSIEELKEYPEITNILPASFRNDFIYFSSFRIIEDVNNGGISFEEETVNQLKNLISIIKHETRKKQQKKFSEKVKISWMLKGEDNLKLFCLIELPMKINLTDQVNNVVMLNFGEQFLAKYKRNQNGEYVLKGNKIKEIEIEEEQDTQINLDGNSNILLVKNSEKPNFELPSLWINEDNNLFYVSTTSTKNNEATVLYNDNWAIKNDEVSDNIISFIQLNSKKINQIVVSDKIEFTSIDNQNSITFSTNRATEYTISFVTIQPKWFNFAQYKTFDKIPEIQVFDAEDKNLRFGFKIYYRFQGELHFHENIYNLKSGLYEILVKFDDKTEIRDYFFLIPSLKISEEIIDEKKGKFIISNEDNLSLKFHSNDILKVEECNNEIIIENLNPKSRPRNFKVFIKNVSQSKGCNLYISLPFSGVFIIDSLNKLVEVTVPLVLDNTLGYRLYVPNDKTKCYFAKITNISYPGIKSEVKLRQGSNDLLTIQEDVNKLMLLSSINSGIPKIKMDIYEESQRQNGNKKRLSTYFFKRYNSTFSRLKDENTFSTKKNVYIIPLNVKEELLKPYLLEFDELDYGYYLTELNEEIKEFCLITDDLNCYTLPKYVNYSTVEDFKIYLNNEVVDFDEFKIEKPYAPLLAERIERIERISNNLSESPLFLEESEWTILKKYVDLCLEFKLPFNTFDHINAIAINYNLYAKFIFNLLSSEKKIDELIQIIQRIEDNIGVSLLWVPIKTWLNLFSNEEIDLSRFMELFRSFYSTNSFATEIVNFIFTQAPDSLEENEFIVINNNYHKLKGKIDHLRQELGESVNDLPKTYPVIESYFRNSMPIDLNENKGLITIKLAPLAAALSLSGNSTRIWKESVENSKENTEFIKRTVLYLSNLYPNWYYSTVYHFIKK